MKQLSIYLFGKFRVLVDEKPLPGIEAAKAQELLCYLLLYPDRPHHRERLASLLWAENSTEQAKKYLRKALWQLQQAFEPINQSLPLPLLLIEPEWVQFNPEVDVRLDVGALQKIFHQVRGVPGDELDLVTAQLIKNAAAIYQGDLLEGWYQDWCLFERERLQNMLLILLGKLMLYCEAQQYFEEGQIYGMRVLSFDKAREYTHRQLMRLYYLAGDRVSALRQYHKCKDVLMDELGVDPARSTQALYGAIRADMLIESDCTETTAAKPGHGYG